MQSKCVFTEDSARQNHSLRCSSFQCFHFRTASGFCFSRRSSNFLRRCSRRSSTSGCSARIFSFSLPRRFSRRCRPGTSLKIQITRGATLIHSMTCALVGIPAYSRQLTYALTSQNTRYITTSFPVPSAVHLVSCFSIRLSPSRTLCARMKTFISASTVYWFTQLNFLYKIAQDL